MELSTLTGRTSFLELEGLVVDGVEAEEDTASCNGVGATVVAAGTIGGNNDSVAVRRVVFAAIADSVVARNQFDLLRAARASADMAILALATNEVPSRDVALLFIPVVPFTI